MDEITAIRAGTAVSQHAAANEFARVYGGRFAFCHDHGRWFEYDGNIWRMCRVPAVFHMIREMCAKLAADGATNASKLTAADFCFSVEKFCRAAPIFARTNDYWDRDLFIIGTPDGTVDLLTGHLRPAMQSDNITKSTAVAPEELADCGTWLRFLDEATDKDADRQRFLQQIAGMALTGDISEQALFFIHGPGGGGKGTFIHAITEIAGDYAKASAMETFAAHKSNQHSTDLANLAGARLVTSSETEEGTGWNEARIKQLTGGDVISARFMRQDFFEYMPQFTLLIVGNHEPTLRTVDEAMRRRFNIIPFTHMPKEVDTELRDKLRAEYPGILRWMIEGCLDWQEHGLIRPQSVIDATEAYFEDQNMMQQWVNQDCEVELTNQHRIETAADLFESWAKFAKAHGVTAGTSKTFKPALMRLGFGHRRASKGSQFTGITLIRPYDEYSAR